MAEVALHRLSKQYPGGGRLAARDLSLTVADGEFVVLLGPSGCGKTTVLRMIAGLEKPTSGSVLIAGSTVDGLPPHERNVAMVFQDATLYPHMTAAQNLAFALKSQRLPRTEIDKRVRAAAEMLQIADLLPKRPAAMSGGERQRVALGRALVRLPEASCVLFDEPLSNLDASLRTALRDELRTLHRRLKMTAIYVTHDQAEAMALADRVVVMGEGAIQQQGRPLEVYRRPANRFVAGFIGTPRMNMLSGVLSVEHARAIFVEYGGGRSELGEDAAARLAAAGTRQVTLGIRPEDLRVAIASASDSRSPCVQGVVQFVDRMGSQTLMHAKTAGGGLVIAIAPMDLEPREQSAITLRFDPAAMHLFETGPWGPRLL